MMICPLFVDKKNEINEEKPYNGIMLKRSKKGRCEKRKYECGRRKTEKTRGEICDAEAKTGTEK